MNSQILNALSYYGESCFNTPLQSVLERDSSGLFSLLAVPRFLALPCQAGCRGTFYRIVFELWL